MSILNNVIPQPATIAPAEGAFTLTADTAIMVEPATAELNALGAMLAGMLRPATGYALPVVEAAGAPGGIHLDLVGGDPGLGAEGYELVSATDGVRITAHRPAGLFYGSQTLRQLLPAAIERGRVQPGPWIIPAGTIRDMPRFAWRGMMLDVARHFFPVADIQRLIDLLASYKLNRLHLHLTDDQGWRIEIKSWPRLAEYGGATAVGGGSGGYYTQAEYAEIVRYAQERHIVVVPEIDMPGHINAALASYPELNCNKIAPALYTGIAVGFSSLCTENELTYRFLDDVLGELAMLTPGPYLHIGGDEAAATPEPAYIRFIERVQVIVAQHGKQTIGWEEIAKARLQPGASAQFWTTNDQGPELARAAAQQGAQVILSPASRTYLDMQYDPATPLGLHWAGHVEAQAAYDWDPATLVPGLPEASILGIESPLWTETVETFEDIAFLAFPRLVGHAEIGWSPAAGHAWDTYRLRLAAQGPRWDAQGVSFYRSPQVAWQ